MQLCKERGLSTTYQEYLALPIGVLEDLRVLVSAEYEKREFDARRRPSH